MNDDPAGSEPITFEVFGIPRPQGSKKAFSADGRAMMKESGGLDHARWRNAVADAAKNAADSLPGPLSGPLRLDIVYRSRDASVPP